MDKTDRVVLGAGDFFVANYTSGELNTDSVISDANFMGNTSGGATLTYTPELKTVESDNGRLKKTFMSKASAELKTGLLTFTLKSLASLMSVGQCTTNSTSGKTTLKLGGGKAALRKFAVVFVYKDDETELRVGIIATNTSPLTLAMVKDTETVPDIVFNAESNGVDDTIVVIEEIPAYHYELTEDTSVQSGKTYYTEDGGEYAPVSSPTGNPHTLGYYELVQAD